MSNLQLIRSSMWREWATSRNITSRTQYSGIGKRAPRSCPCGPVLTTTRSSPSRSEHLRPTPLDCRTSLNTVSCVALRGNDPVKPLPRTQSRERFKSFINRYPVKEPFVRLIQGSLNTFLNAFTYPDRTVYPVASRNLPDFYNLASVYLDAVFYPRAAHDPRILAQEGWHYELENASDPLTVTGVVLNEMKGVYSNPEALLARVTQQALFPDNTYSVDSGGDPTLIPTLEFRDFQLFHETFYSPSNARLYFYGDDPEIARLDLAHASLSAKEHSRGDPQVSAVKRQPALRGLDPVRTRYPAQSNSSGVYTTLNWVLNEFTVDADTALALAVVDHLLLGTSASILRLRLIQTGLGDTVVGGGLDTTLQHMTFSVGLKGVKTEENASAVIDMVNMCLAEVAEVGFSDDAIEASVNTIEFQLREFNTGGYPKGLILLLNALNTWIYDGDPFEYLRYDEPLRRLKAALHAKSPVLKNIVKRYLVNNEHRVAVYLIPDDRLEAASQAKETATLSATKMQMNTADIEQILEQTRELKKMQSAVDSDDALRTIPRLSIMDLVLDERETPPDIMQAETGGTILTHSLSTNGIVYIDLCVEMTSFIPSPDVPFLPLFERLLLEVDTANHTRVDFSRLIAAKTGGLRVSHTVVTPAMENPKARVAMEEDARLFLTLRGKCTLERMNDLFQIVYDALFSANLGDRGRIIEILRESVSSFKTRVVSSGHVFVASTIGAHGTTVGSLNERLAGISAFRATERMLELANAEDTYEHVLTALERLRRKVLAAITSSACVINISADGESLPTAIASARHFLKSSLHSVSKITKTVEGDFDVLDLSTGQHGDTVGQKHANPILGFTIPTTVNYVGSGGRLFDPGEYVSGTAAVAVKLLSTRCHHSHTLEIQRVEDL
eukprot:m.130207 g.130207  ORF g.130207 m.130207 type:complete len:899 (-) comp13705_c0_seq2:521-3217(-)